ncbi:MAG: hypothetical protein K2Y37_04125 [Pirellulales bacterium]|nr:hypothetical protein [Pirellulales bacterium]
MIGYGPSESLASAAQGTGGAREPKLTTIALRATMLVLVFLAFLASGLWVRAPYRDAFFWADDYLFLREIGLYQTGRLSFSGYLFENEGGGHFLALGKLLFYLEWRAFGLNTSNWRLVTELVQAGSALMLYLLLRAYRVAALGAFAGALLWAGMAGGGVDNPLQWLTCQFFAISLALVLAAMVVVSHTSRLGRWSPWLVFTLSSVAVLTWSNALPMLGAIPLQVRMLGWNIQAGTAARLRRQVLIAVGGAAGLVAAPQLLVLAMLTMAGGRELHLSVTEHGERTSAQTVSACGILIYDLPPVLPMLRASGANQRGLGIELWEFVSKKQPEIANALYPHQFAQFKERLSQVARPLRLADFLAPGALAGVLLAVSLAVAAPPGRVLLMILFAMTLMQSFLINLGSTGDSLAEAIGFTHYVYHVALPWCACLGVLADATVRASRRVGAAWLALVWVLPITAVLVHQRTVAADGREMFDAAACANQITHRWNELLFEQIAQRRSNQAARLILPDVPTTVSVPQSYYWPASAYFAAMLPQVTCVEFVSCGDCGIRQWQEAVALFAGHTHHSANDWSGNVSSCYRWAKALEFLDRRANLRGTVLAIPDIDARFDNAMTVPLSSFLKWGYRVELKHLRIVSHDSMKPADRTMLAARVEELPEDVRHFWQAQLSLGQVTDP